MRNHLYHIIMSFALALMLTTAFMTHDTHALSASHTIKVCEKNFIGSNYKPQLEKTCGLLWKHWTYQILSTNN